MALWVLTFQNTPLPNWNVGRSWHFEYFDFPVHPPPRNGNVGRSWHFEYFEFPEHPPPLKMEISADLGTLSILIFQNTPPKMEIWADLGTLSILTFQNTPPPSEKNWILGRSWHFGFWWLEYVETNRCIPKDTISFSFCHAYPKHIKSSSTLHREQKRGHWPSKIRAVLREAITICPRFTSKNQACDTHPTVSFCFSLSPKHEVTWLLNVHGAERVIISTTSTNT